MSSFSGSYSDVVQKLVQSGVVLFLIVWLVYGAFMKARDLEAYGLQQVGIYVIVEHGTFALNVDRHPSLPKIGGDTFMYEGRQHFAKQPGQFVLGALAYAPLRILGLAYERDYVTTAAWVSWLSSSSFAAAAVCAVVALARLWGFSVNAALLAGFVFAFGTPLFAYSGIAHHDVISAAMVLFALLNFETARLRGWEAAWLFGGLFCGLALFVSMLPALIVMVLLASTFVGARVKKLALVATGFGLGVLPLAVYNWYYFHSPFTQANVAGNYTDTFFQFPSPFFFLRLREYLGFGELSLWLYAPAAGLGLALLIAVFLNESRLRFPVGVIIAATFIHFAYLLNIQTEGGCQFGPRYLLPSFGLFCLALAPAFDWKKSRAPKGRAMQVLILSVSLVSIAFGLSGAMAGTMLCDLSIWMPGKVYSGELPPTTYPLRTPMLVALAVVLILSPKLLGFGRPAKQSL